MSIDTTRIHCTGCGYEYFENYRPITLKCQHGSGVVTYDRTNAWCFSCDKITYVESLQSIADIREEYAEFFGIPGPPVTGLKKLLRRFDKQYAENMHGLNLKLAWREARTALPRCLTCSSTQIGTLDFTRVAEYSAMTETFRHSCGGALVHDYQDKTGIRFNFATTEIWMDINGNKISEGIERRERRFK